MRDVARLLSNMLSAGVITEYAVFGAVAQMRYTEAVSTMDADVLVAIPGPPSLDLLRPLYDYCSSRGFAVEGESIRVVRADHLAVIALSVGRPKDHVRILSLLDAGSVDEDTVGELAARHGLEAVWRHFQSRFLER